MTCWGCVAEAGLVSVGVITIDGTKIKANASMDQNRSYRELVEEILREAEETDRREDELYGETRGDELPEQLRTPEGRRAALEEAKRRIEERKGRAISADGAARRWRWIRSWCSVAVGVVVGGASGLGSRGASSKQPRARSAAGSARPGGSSVSGARPARGEPPGRPGRQRGLRALAGDRP